jgi:hypothetical protein
MTPERASFEAGLPRRTSRSHRYRAADRAVLDDCDSAAQGGWIIAVERLVRWLKNNDCSERAQPLSRQAKPFHHPPTDRHREMRALAVLADTLARLRLEPPTDLDSKKRARLARLVQNAAALVKHRLKELPAQIECERKARDAVQKWMDEQELSEVENVTEGNFLEALYVLEAFDKESRVPLSKVVKEAEGSAADPDNFKQLAARLGPKHKRLIDSKGAVAVDTG